MSDPSPTNAKENAPEERTNETTEEVEIPVDPAAVAADRAGFKFLAIGFAIFFVIIAVCASIVALVMKSMGI